MFESLPLAPPDSILGLSEEFQKDARPEKVNLTVGVFKTDGGQTPVLDSVKAAEERLLSSEKTKGYLGIEGMNSYLAAVNRLVLGESFDASSVAAVQSPGGTGALRIAADLLAKFSPSKRIWVSDPTWANHTAIFKTAGLDVHVYPYVAADGASGDIAGMLSQLRNSASRGDLLCLHACCHNPTGIDPSSSEWDTIAEVIRDIGLFPLVDFAYQGFGDGLEADREPLQKVLAAADESIVCASFSKNFGLYSERTGAVLFVGQDAASAELTLSQAKSIVRTNYSNPPRHGAAIVSEILNDPKLTEQWRGEVDAMRGRIDRMRDLFVRGMEATDAEVDFSFLRTQKGMFSYTGLTPQHAAWLKQNKAVYILGTGRINVAGMSTQTMDYLCESLAQCIRSVGVRPTAASV